MKENTIVAVNINVHNHGKPLYKKVYYRLTVGVFIINAEDVNYRFSGLHFICLGSDYFHNMKGTIRGFELFDEPYTIVNELPENIF